MGRRESSQVHPSEALADDGLHHPPNTKALLEPTSSDEHRFERGLMAPKERKVWMDDFRRPPDESWEWIETASQTIVALEDGNVTRLSLDHDLGACRECSEAAEEWIGRCSHRGTGTDVTKWLVEAVVERGLKMPVVTVHSANPVGRERMQSDIDSIERLLSEKRT